MASSGEEPLAHRLRRLKVAFQARGQWQDSEYSTGEFVQSMDFMDIWEAKGPARTQYEVLSQEILVHVQRFCESTSRNVVWSLYMIGTKKEKSTPTIVFSSNDKKSRRQLRQSVKESGLLAKWPGFITMDCNRDPGFPTCSPLVKEVARIKSSGKSQPSKAIALRPELHIISGAQVTVKGSYTDASREERTATIGGYLTSGGEYFETTVAHVFDRSIGNLFSDMDDPVDFEYDIDDPAAYSEDPEQSIQTADAEEAGPSSALIKTKSLDDRSKSDSEREASPHPLTLAGRNHDIKLNVKDAERSLSVLGPYASSADVLDRALDVALIKPAEEDLFAFCGLQSDSLQRNFTLAIAQQLKNLDVLILNSRGAPKIARISGTPSFLKVAERSRPQELWTVRSNDHIDTGNCGSWVVTPDYRTVYGHVVAGSLSTGSVYVVPLKHVITNLKETLGGEWSAGLTVIPAAPLSPPDSLRSRSFSGGSSSSIVAKGPHWVNKLFARQPPVTVLEVTNQT